MLGNYANASTAELRQQVLAQHKKIGRKNKNLPKSTTIMVYSAVFAVIISFVAIGYRPPKNIAGVAYAQSGSMEVSLDRPSVDQLVATTVAADVAESTNLPIADNVANLSLSLAAKNELAQTNDTVISKPQIVQPQAGNRAISQYVVQAGDSADTLATRFGISKQTLKWANNLTSDAIEVNKVLTIPPVDGVVYTVRPSDSIDTIAEKYRVDKSRLVSFNDLELGGLSANMQIVLPGGTLPATEQPGYTAPRAAYSYGGSYTILSNQMANASVGNRYARGYCTWYVYERRLQLGRPVGSFWGNAATWAAYARAAGYTVNNTPAPGAIMQNGGGAGHVAVVESVGADGSVTLSEMNYAGNFNRVTSRTISAGTAAGFTFIH